MAQDADRGPRGGARCDCGHVRVLHQHARAGLDCGVCGPTACPQYRRRPLWSRVVRVRHSRPLGAPAFDQR